MPTLLLWLAFLPTLLILYLMLNWLPTLVVAKGLDRAVAPQASLAFNWASVAGALLIGWLVDRFGPRWPLTLSYAALIVSLVALGAASDHADHRRVQRRRRLLPARRQLRAVRRRAVLLPGRHARHRLRSERRRRPSRLDPRAARRRDSSCRVGRAP